MHTLQTVNSVDPVAMMKHSMSGISDQQVCMGMCTGAVQGVFIEGVFVSVHVISNVVFCYDVPLPELAHVPSSR